MSYAPNPFPDPGQGPWAMAAPPLRPRRLWYLAALAVLLGGVAWLVAVVRARRIARRRSPGGPMYPPAASGGFLSGL